MNSILPSLLARIQEGASSGSNLWFLLIAYLLLWGLIFGYLFFLHKKMTVLEEKINETGTEEERETSSNSDNE